MKIAVLDEDEAITLICMIEDHFQYLGDVLLSVEKKTDCCSNTVRRDYLINVDVRDDIKIYEKVIAYIKENRKTDLEIEYGMDFTEFPDVVEEEIKFKDDEDVVEEIPIEDVQDIL
jgi:hypothetical protein